MNKNNHPTLPLYGFVADGEIYSQAYNETKKIGVTNDIYDALKAEFDTLSAEFQIYKDRLIELGEIEVPLTPEEIAHQQTEITANLTQQLLENQKMISKLADRVEHLAFKIEGSRHESVQNHSRNRRKKYRPRPNAE